MKILSTSTAIAAWLSSPISTAFQIQTPSLTTHVNPRIYSPTSPTRLFSSTSSSDPSSDPCTIQILMSDTGGGHRASANALRDAFSILHATEPSSFPSPIHCDIVDIYTDYGPFFPFNSYVGLYKIMAEYSFLWKWFYEFGSTPLGLWLNSVGLEVGCFESFRECLERDPLSGVTTAVVTTEGKKGGKEVKRVVTNKRADMVVSVHPLCQDLPLKILTELDTHGQSRDIHSDGRKTPFVTVVTDLGGAHPTWFNDGVDKCFVPSPVLKEAALARKVKEEKIVMYGLPIRRGFWRFGADYDKMDAVDAAGGKGEVDIQEDEKEEMQPGVHHKPTIRQSLGLLDIPTVLIVGGGDGMGGIVAQAKAVGDRLERMAAKLKSTNSNNDNTNDTDNTDDTDDDGPIYQMVVICGKNKSAQTSLSPPQTDYDSNLISTSIRGFVDNMDEYMRASDILITKAGPGTIAEASICGLPCILSSYLPGQEEGNVPYVEENGFGCYRGEVEGMADCVQEWLEGEVRTTESGGVGVVEGSALERMRECALRAARPDATLDIARDIARMVYERREEVRREKEEGEKGGAVEGSIEGKEEMKEEAVAAAAA